MRNTIPAAAVIGALLMLALPSSSLAGVPIDPNLNDVPEELSRTGMPGDARSARVDHKDGRHSPVMPNVARPPGR